MQSCPSGWGSPCPSPRSGGGANHGTDLGHEGLVQILAAGTVIVVVIAPFLTAFDH